MTHWAGVSVVLDGDATAAIRSLSRVGTVCRRAQLTAVSNETLVIDDEWRPTWTVTVSRVLFPFGLLALTHRRHGQLVVLTRPAAGGMTEVVITGDASRRLTRAMRQAINQSVPSAGQTTAAANAGAHGRLTLARRALQRNALQRWLFASGLAVLAFVLASVATGSAWDVWTDVVGNVVLALLVVGLAARFLGLWPNNRVINWRRVRLPATH